MSEEPTRIPIDEADFADLKHFATLLGIEVKHGTNAAQLRAKIAACAPDVKDVPRPTPPAPPVVAQPDPATQPASEPAQAWPVDGEDPARRPAAVSRPASRALLSHLNDPRVRIRINKTDDKRRARDVFVSVNGVTLGMQRGVEIDIPYRFYLALEHAKEKNAVETDEINPLTGQPVMSWEEVYSYPFMVLAMPSKEEIEAWHEATKDGFQDGPALKVAA